MDSEQAIAAAKLAGGGENRGEAWRGVALLLGVATVGYIGRVGLTVVAPQMMAEFHWSQAQMGEAFSAFLATYTLMQAPSGWMADRWPARPLFSGLVLAWAILAGATATVGWWGGAAGALVALLGLRALFGITAAPTYPLSARCVADWLPPELQGRGNGLAMASIGLGSALAPPLVGEVATHWGWRIALAAIAVLMLPLAALWWRWAPHRASRKREKPRVAANWREWNARGGFGFLCASYFLQSYLGYIFVFWFYLYLVQVRHFALMRAAWITTLPWLSSLAAIPLGGALSDMAVRRWGARWGRRITPIAAMAGASLCLWIGARTNSGAIAAGALTAATALVIGTEASYWATMSQITGPQSGFAGGLMNFGGNLGGMISPVLTPWLASFIGWPVALSLTAGLGLCGAALWIGVDASAATAPTAPGI